MSEVVAPAASADISQTSGANEVINTIESPEAANEVDTDVKAAIAEEVADMKRKFKLKVDGEEFEEELDLSDEDGIKQKLQLARVAQKRMQETKTMQKDIQDFINSARNNPIEALGQLGVNFDDLAEQYVNSKLEELEKSPEQLAQEKQLKELEELRAEREKLKSDHEASELKRMQEKYVTEIDNDIEAALSSTDFKLPKSPYVVKRMAETMMLAMENGFTDVKAKDVLPIVEKQFHGDFQEMFGRLPEEVLEQMVGKGNIDRLRKFRLSKARKAKTQTAKQIAPSTGNNYNKQKEEVERIPSKDFFKSLK